MPDRGVQAFGSPIGWSQLVRRMARSRSGWPSISPGTGCVRGRGKYGGLVAGERTYAILPCADLTESVGFYRSMGFEVTYEQRRPNPYAVVVREEIQVHLAEIGGFDPSQSYGSVIVAVPDLDALHDDVTARLRAVYGKLPATGIPRVLRLRRKEGTARGFSIVDPGGNWLRFYRVGDGEEKQRSTGLDRAVDNAALRADVQGDDIAGRRLVANGLERHPAAPAGARVRALAYLAELDIRLGCFDAAAGSIDTARGIVGSVDDETRAALSYAEELLKAATFTTIEPTQQQS